MQAEWEREEALARCAQLAPHHHSNKQLEPAESVLTTTPLDRPTGAGSVRAQSKPPSSERHPQESALPRRGRCPRRKHQRRLRQAAPTLSLPVPTAATRQEVR